MTDLIHGITYTIVALVLLTGIGNVACRMLFSGAGLKSETSGTTSDVQPAGWIIGWLERIVLAVGILTQSWEVLAAVIALKTVARFKELDDQRFAEYFLVGSLFSLLWAVLTTGAWIAYDQHFGSNIRSHIAGIIGTVEQSTSTCNDMCTVPSSAELRAPHNGGIDCVGQAIFCAPQAIGEQQDEHLSTD